MKEYSREQKKKLLLICSILAALSSLILVACLLISCIYDTYLKLILIAIGLVIFIPSTLIALRLEQIAGPYECQNCGNKYTPSYMKFVFSTHLIWDRNLRCPICRKRNWHKKDLL